MILSGDSLQKTQKIVSNSACSVENVELYKQLNLFPRNFGYTQTSWTDWLKVHGGPEYAGVALTAQDVKDLREVLDYITDYEPGDVSALTSTSKNVLKKVGLRPEDLALSGTWS